MSTISDKTIVSEAQWNQARRDLLEREKALNKLRDEIAAERRNLPWHPVKEDYLFSGPEGPLRLSELFGSNSQLIVYHFMYGPDWQEGCKSCSFWADQYDGISRHIAARDVSLAVVSRAPWQNFQAFKQRMNWGFTWLSSAGNTFNSDYHISFPNQQTGYYNYKQTTVMEELPGLSVFFKDDKGKLFHTYSTYARGLDPLNAAYQMLDLVPKGRDEADLAYGMAWVKHHDDY